MKILQQISAINGGFSVSNDLLQQQINIKQKILQNKKKLEHNLKNLELVEKEVQGETAKINAEKKKYNEWAKYFGDNVKAKEVLHWFDEELKKLKLKMQRVNSMRDKIFSVQAKLEQQFVTVNQRIEALKSAKFDHKPQPKRSDTEKLPVSKESRFKSPSFAHTGKKSPPMTPDRASKKPDKKHQSEKIHPERLSNQLKSATETEVKAETLESKLNKNFDIDPNEILGVTKSKIKNFDTKKSNKNLVDISLSDVSQAKKLSYIKKQPVTNDYQQNVLRVLTTDFNQKASQDATKLRNRPDRSQKDTNTTFKTDSQALSTQEIAKQTKIALERRAKKAKEIPPDIDSSRKGTYSKHSSIDSIPEKFKADIARPKSKQNKALEERKKIKNRIDNETKSIWPISESLESPPAESEFEKLSSMIDPILESETQSSSINIVDNKTPVSQTKLSSDILYLGIDLGTCQTTISSSNGHEITIKSAVGWTQDLVLRKMLKKNILFGDEALKNKLALKFYRPLEKGVIKNTDDDLRAVHELIKYLVSHVEPDRYKKVYAVIGAPAAASMINEQAIIDAARETVDAVTIVSEPFAVAYGEANIYNTLVIDIGAGTTDICCLKGTLPKKEDQINLEKAGDYIDNQLMDIICERIRGAQVTKDVARKWKEAHSFVMTSQVPAIVDVAVMGKPLKVDITSLIQKSCESIVDDITKNVIQLVSGFDPEFQAMLKKNIILAGGGSLIRNLDTYLTQKLSSLGKVVITRIKDPIVAGARGALALAQDVTDDFWRSF